MAKTVEIPDELHEQLEARARREGVSLPELFARELARAAAKRPLDDILDEVVADPAVDLPVSTADILRELRGPLPEADDDRR